MQCTQAADIDNIMMIIKDKKKTMILLSIFLLQN